MRDHDDGSGRWDAGGLFDGRPDAAGLALLAEVHGAAGFTVERVDDRDWVAQVRAELTPVEAGRFVVYGSHDRGRVPPSRIGLEIEAAQAFGTGHHATTQGCLLALDRLAKAGFRPRRVADVGAGTGVLAMAAARLWPLRAVAGDIDPVATATARANAAANGVGTRVGLRHRGRACAIRGCGRERPTTSSSPTSSPARCGAWRASSPARRRRAGWRSCRASSRGRRRRCSPPIAAGATGRRTRWRSGSGGRWCCARG